MVSVSSSFSGLSAANITALFGTAASSSDSTAKDSINSSTGATSATPITGASATTNAAKAIQAIVTKIQLEKSQTDVQGKLSTYDLASVSQTYEKTVNVGTRTVQVGVTALDEVASATADDTAGAEKALLTRINAEEATIEAGQGGQLMSKDQIVYGGNSVSTMVTWTANSVTLATKGAANRGVELYEQESALGDLSGFSAQATKYQTPSVASPSGGTEPTPDSSETASGTAPSTTGSALYLVVSRQQAGSFDALLAKEQDLVSAFQNGALAGQNGTSPGNGAGFSYNWATDGEEGEDQSFYSVSGVMISNYDPATVANNTMHPNSDQKNAAMGGTIVNDDYLGGSETMTIIVPLKTS